MCVPWCVLLCFQTLQKRERFHEIVLAAKKPRRFFLYLAYFACAHSLSCLHLLLSHIFCAFFHWLRLDVCLQPPSLADVYMHARKQTQTLHACIYLLPMLFTTTACIYLLLLLLLLLRKRR